MKVDKKWLRKRNGILKMVAGSKPYHFARKNIVFCQEDETIAQAAASMLFENVGSIVVVDSNGKYSGILTYQKILRFVADDKSLVDVKIEKLEPDPIVYVAQHAKNQEVLKKFMESPSGRVLMKNNED